MLKLEFQVSAYTCIRSYLKHNEPSKITQPNTST